MEVSISSPFKMKITEEKKTTGKEKVDLEIGAIARRSLVETSEYGVLDLCGDIEAPEAEKAWMQVYLHLLSGLSLLFLGTRMDM